MKKSVIYSTAILLVVTALCLTAVTFSFFTSKQSNIEVDIDSLATTALTFNVYGSSGGPIIAKDASNLYEIPVKMQDGYITCTIKYQTQKEYKADMFFTVKEFKVKSKVGENIVERTAPERRGSVPQNESDYIASLLNYQVQKIATEDESKPPVEIDWKPETAFPVAGTIITEEIRKQYFNMGKLNGKVEKVVGYLRFYMKLKDDVKNELLPANVDGYTIQVVLEARELS